jgi:hypothetical protein
MMSVISTEDFLDCVLPPGNRYIGFTNGNVGPSGRPIIACSPFDEGKRGVAIGARHLDQDVYFALASFKQARIYDAEKGYMKSFRKEENVDSLKSVWLDVDFKMYETPEACVRGVKEFLDGGIPNPTFIVNSGGGLHLYWVFEEALAIERWRPLAQGMAALAKRMGLRADYGVTIDAARVLRLPGTVNHKYPSKPRVEVAKMGAYASLDRMSELLTPHAAAFGNPTQARITVSSNVINLFDPATRGDLSAGYEAGKESRFEQIVKHCATLQEVVATQGANDNYPKWKDVLHLLAYVTDGRDFIHTVSKGHPAYDPHEVDARFEESVIIKAENRRGPTTCERFSASSSKCSTCKYLGQIKSPWSLGVTVEHGVDADPSYVIGEKTFRNKPVAGDDGATTVERVMVCDAAAENWRLVPILNAVDDKHKLLVDIRAKSFRQTAELLPSTLGDMRALKKMFYGSYLTWQEAEMKEFAKVSLKWIEKLRREQDARPVDAFGWGTDGTFVIGKEQLARDGSSAEVSAPQAIAHEFTVKGDAAPWKKLAARLCADKHPDYSFILAAGFAAPLMRFGTPLSLALSVFSMHSAAGKSTALKTIQGAFGFPRAMFSLDDTHNYIMQRAGVLRDMPALWDEIRGENVAKEMTNLLFRLTQGKTKGRLTQAAEARPTFELNTMLICATNTPIADYINQMVKQTDAGAMRFMEFEMLHRPTDNVQEIYDLVGEMEHNYGHAGRDYLKYLVANYDQIVPTMKAVSARIAQDYTFAAQERFWRDGVVKIVTAAVLLNKSGVMPIDPRRVLDFAVEVVKRQRLQLIEVSENSDELLDVIVHSYANELLITDAFTTAGPRHTISVKRPPRTSEVSIHVSVKDRAARIELRAIHDFAERHKLSASNTVKSLCDRWGARKTKCTMGGGTQFSRMAPVRAIEIDLTQLGDAIISAWDLSG